MNAIESPLKLRFIPDKIHYFPQDGHITPNQVREFAGRFDRFGRMVAVIGSQVYPDSQSDEEDHLFITNKKGILLAHFFANQDVLHIPNDQEGLLVERTRSLVMKMRRNRGTGFGRNHIFLPEPSVDTVVASLILTQNLPVFYGRNPYIFINNGWINTIVGCEKEEQTSIPFRRHASVSAFT